MAADTATVMPRSLNEPVGLAPSIFSHTSAPTRSDSTGACTSGVPPSPSVTSGSTGSRARESQRLTSSRLEGLLHDADHAPLVAQEVEPARQAHGGVEARPQARGHDHSEPRVRT